MELAVVMPCLDEAATVRACVLNARRFLEDCEISGEVIVVDNGSSDTSAEIARGAGARVVRASQRGYGSAVMAGVRAADGRYVAMADCDGSYDLTELLGLVNALRDGADLVVGDRFAGGIEPGAMPVLHRYLGNPVLSALVRKMFNSKVRDVNCGMRAFDRTAILALNLATPGMEFASEMVVQAELAGYDLRQVPVTLRNDGRGGQSGHLHPWRDGWRHLRFMVRARKIGPARGCDSAAATLKS